MCVGGGVGYGAPDGGAVGQDGQEKLGKFIVSRRPIRFEQVLVCVHAHVGGGVNFGVSA